MNIFKFFKRYTNKFTNLLEPEDQTTVNVQEKRIRYYLQLVFRFICSTFLVWILFDFLFSSIWIHGYIWSLNLPLDHDLTDVAAGLVVELQENIVGKIERSLNALSTTMAVSILLICCGFASNTNRTIMDLVKISGNVGLITGLGRTMQMKNRLFSCLHEGFYCYFITFAVGLMMTLQTNKLITSETTLSATEQDEEIKRDCNNNILGTVPHTNKDIY
ncbi:unnamed protein product [Auanema sp. JU1783]|nr:unnamed protein product [Auanema sp. JU1783]